MALPITLPISLPLELPIAFTFNVTKHCSDYFCKTLAAGVANGDTNGVTDDVIDDVTDGVTDDIIDDVTDGITDDVTMPSSTLPISLTVEISEYMTCIGAVPIALPTKSLTTYRIRFHPENILWPSFVVFPSPRAGASGRPGTDRRGTNRGSRRGGALRSNR